MDLFYRKRLKEARQKRDETYKNFNKVHKERMDWFDKNKIIMDNIDLSNTNHEELMRIFKDQDAESEAGMLELEVARDEANKALDEHTAILDKQMRLFNILLGVWLVVLFGIAIINHF